MIGTAQHRLACHTAVCSRYVVRSKEVATACSQRVGIIIPVGLAVRVGRPCGRTRVNREGCTRIGDVVVGHHVGWTKCGRDVIGTPGDCLARGAGVSRC